MINTNKNAELLLAKYTVSITNGQFGVLTYSLADQIDGLNDAIKNGADLDLCVENLSSNLHLTDLLTEFLLNNLSPNHLVLAALKAKTTYPDFEKITNERYSTSIMNQHKLIEEAIKRGADLDFCINKLFDFSQMEIDDSIVKLLAAHVEPETLLALPEFFSGGTINIRGSNGKLKELPNIFDEVKDTIFQEAVKRGVDFDAVHEADDISMTTREYLILHKQIDLVPADNNVEFPPLLAIIIFFLGSAETEFKYKVIEKFPNCWSAEKVHELARAQGLSNVISEGFTDIFFLMKDYVDSINGLPILSEQEMTLLNPNIDPVADFSLYDASKFQNKYGFTPLHVALITKKLDLASNIITQGAELLEVSALGLSVSTLLNLLNIENENLAQTIVDHLPENIDMIDEMGESFVDSLFTNDVISNQIVERSNDNLFYLFKEEADPFAPSLNPELTHIAISHDQGFWSTGVWSWARLANKLHPHIKFHLVGLEMMQLGGEQFFKQFDGWINPGGGDDYPNDKEFNMQSWQTRDSLIHTYQYALNYTTAYNIPTWGMCAGAQNFVLHHQGYLKPIEKYSFGQHTILPFKGTLPHFMALSAEQQKKALFTCALPEIFFKGDTAHSYAGVTYNLGKGLTLGGISEDGVAMYYNHENGLAYATQFHPEHHFHMPAEEGKVNHEFEMLNNFLKLATLHHDYRIGKLAHHPKKIIACINERIKQCVEAPTSLIEDTLYCENVLLDTLFFNMEEFA